MRMCAFARVCACMCGGQVNESRVHLVVMMR